MPNLVSELIREYKKSLLARRRAKTTGSSPAPTPATAPKPKQLLPRWPEAKPHRPRSDYRLRESQL
jgi:hypothetical protein